MLITQRHKINATPEIVRLCKLSKELYNQANYLVRKSFFSKQKLPNQSDLYTHFCKNELFLGLGRSRIANFILRQCLIDWTNFFKTLRAYKKNPDKFTHRPGPPKYKRKLNCLIFDDENIRRKPLKQNIIIPTNDLFQIKSDIKNFKQVVLVPQRFGFVVEISYEQKESKIKKSYKGICSLDLGVNNLVAITSDKTKPILINGRILKDINRQFNKSRCKRTSNKRYWRIENYFHHTSKFIIDYCKQYKIGTIVIGRNLEWKQKVNLGKKNNQTFYYIPYCKLIQKIEYKAKLNGIQIIFVDESYTSQASFKNRDDMIKDFEFTGRRITRGLFKNDDDSIINADINGSANIARKVFQDRKTLSRLDRSLAERPILINPLKNILRITARYGFVVKSNLY